MRYHQNIVRIKSVYGALQELADQVVFVGGATVSLYADHQIGHHAELDSASVFGYHKPSCGLLYTT